MDACMRRLRSDAFPLCVFDNVWLSSFSVEIPIIYLFNFDTFLFANIAATLRSAVFSNTIV